MHPLSTAAATSFLSTLLLLLHLTASYPSNDTSSLSNCNQNFSCGALTNITYPFTGGERPYHCGPPEFQLTCDGNSLTTLKGNSQTYRVFQVDQANQTLRLSPLGFYDDVHAHTHPLAPLLIMVPSVLSPTMKPFLCFMGART